MRFTAKLLVAAPFESLTRVHESLTGYYDYQVVTTIEEAQAHLSSGIDCILCGLDFDEGRMFDLLRQVKSNEATRHIPFLCIKTNEVQLTPNILQSVEIALRASGAEKLVPLFNWRSELGEAAAFKRLRQRIDDAISV